MFPHQRKLVRHVAIAICVYTILMVATVLVLTQPSFTHYSSTSKKVDPFRLRRHVETLAIDLAPRNYLDPPSLDASTGYISDHFTKAGGRVSEQRFHVQGNAVSEERAKK